MRFFSELARRWGLGSHPEEDYSHFLEQSMDPAPWCLDGARWVDGVLEFDGWALAPGGDRQRRVFLADGIPCEEIRYPWPREDIARLYPRAENARESGFSCRLKLGVRQRSLLDPIGIEFADRLTGKPFGRERACYFFEPAQDSVPFPPGPHRARVHGTAHEESFRVEGYSAFCKIREWLRSRRDEDYPDRPAILDWGCGCGRLSRYFQTVPGLHLSGIDIDAANIDWCSANLKFGRFETIPLSPPTPLPARSFDLIIGISIFTHLRLEDARAWMAELARLCRPGALVMVTTLGNQAAARANLPRPVWESWQREGFWDAGANHDLGTSMEVSDYYRNVLYTPSGFKRLAARHFKVIEHLPAHIGNFQDLFVLRR